MNNETTLALITLLTPGIVAALKQWLPARYLPVAAPLLGLAAELLLGLAGVSDLAPGRGALAGAAGVAVREAFDQNRPRRHG